MKRLKKFLVVLETIFIVLSMKVSYAATSSKTSQSRSTSKISATSKTPKITLENFSTIQIVCVGIGVALILLILFISYKTDKLNENEEDNDKDENNEINDDKIEEVEQIQEENKSIQYDNSSEKSLYESFEIKPKENSAEIKNEELENKNLKSVDSIKSEFPKIKEITQKSKNTSDFQLDEIFNEKVPNLEKSSKDNSIDKKDLKEIEESVSEKETKNLTLEDDFIMQMNKNLEKKQKSAKQATAKINDKNVDKEEKTTKKATKPVAKKTSTKKTEKPVTKKTSTKKTEKTAKKETAKTKSTTKKTTTKSKKEEKSN